MPVSGGHAHPSSSPTLNHDVHCVNHYDHNALLSVVDALTVTDSNGNTSRLNTSAQNSPLVSRGSNNRIVNVHARHELPSRGSSGYLSAYSDNANSADASRAMSRSGSARSNRSSSGRTSAGNGASTGSVVTNANSHYHHHDGSRLSSTSSHSNNSLMSPDNPALQVPAVALTLDATHAHISRAASFRAPKSTNELQVEEGGTHHSRRNSMPNVNNLLNVPGAGASGATPNTDAEPRETRIRRVRSFKTTSKGVIVNRGDSFKKKSTHSLMSTGSTVTDADGRARCNSGNNNSLLGLGAGPAASSYFRVNMMGAAGVGKTSLAHQFLTSEYIGHDDADEQNQMTVTVLLDGEESTIEFIDPPDRNVISEGLEQLLDAYVVVFAINDHSSFETAQSLVRYLRVDYGTDRAILLVANKIDLVRKRKVTADEARLLATTFDCKYAETSAALNHYVDELLVGIISQIRLQLAIPFTTIFFPGKEAKRRKDKKMLCKGPKGFLTRLFRRGGFGSHGGKKDKGVDNLFDY